MKKDYKIKIVTFNRLAIYILTFLVLLSLTFLLTNFWKDWDYSFYKSVYLDETTAADKLSEKIAIVNIEKPNLDSKSASLEVFRNRIISFLNIIEKSEENYKIPEAILFDISFSKDTVLLKELRTAIEDVKAKGTKVYAAYSLKDYFNESAPVFEANDSGQARILYDSILDGGRLHTGFNIVDGLITYPSDIFLNGAFKDSIKIESLVKRVALNEESNAFKSEFEQLVTPLGPREAIEKQKHEFIESQDQSDITKHFDPPLDVHEKFVIVGDLKNDYQQDIATPRTYFLAWALNEKIIDNKIAKQPLDNPTVIVFQTLFLSFFSVLIFALLFKYVKRLQTKPKTLSVISFILSIVFLIIYGLLVYSFDKVIPIGLTLIGILIATLLSWRFAYKFLVTGVADGAKDIDLFISYSHGDSTWVRENVFEPLKDFKVNGRDLKIFYDVKSIKVGEAFTSKYMWGIVDSRLFVPIMSKEYYNKNHCRNEMDLAYKRYVEKLIEIKPIAFSFDCIPPIYQHVIAKNLEEDKNFIDDIKEKLIEIDNKFQKNKTKE